MSSNLTAQLKDYLGQRNRRVHELTVINYFGLRGYTPFQTNVALERLKKGGVVERIHGFVYNTKK